MIDRLLILYAEHKILLKCKLKNVEQLPPPVTDHRELKPGDCFIAIKGANFDGHSFIPKVLHDGAAFCIGETEQAQIVVSDSRKATALYARLYFGDPAAKMTLFGVTGTNGKTTTSLLLYQMLLKLGYKAAWIGTSGYKILQKDFPTRHTTPDILQLYSIFKAMLESGISHVVMEVSSHALALDRVYGVEYDYSLFTNLSRDHLDFHRDMDDYFETKYLLFERAVQTAGKCIVNSDDPHGQMILKRIAETGGTSLSVGRNPDSALQIDAPAIRLDGSEFQLIARKGDICSIHSPLVGDFNIDNLALACGALLAAGVAFDSLPALCSDLQPVPGRIESVPNQLGIGIYVDYAHSPDALDNLLKSVEKLPHARIITIFGAGGDRDQGKRPLMLKAALIHSDVVIVTDDNPRTDNPEKIIYDIVRDAAWDLPWWIIRDRAKAIAAGIRLALDGDIVLICGKGHESYQEIDGVRYDFDDHQTALEALNNLPQTKEDNELILPVDPLLLKLFLGTPIATGAYCQPVCYNFFSTDSRDIKPGSIFFALRGETHDGNRFVDSVLQDPDVMVVASDPAISHPRCLTTERAEVAMAGLLRKYLQLFSIYRIALTGSTGKTSTKELIAQVLAANSEVLKTARNENNIIGLCKTILRLETKHRFAVFEIGTNHFGEIALLADTIIPDAGLIINIGPSHLEHFGDENGVFKEKSELFNRPLNFRIYPADDPRFYAYREDGIGIGFSAEADYRLSELVISSAGLSFKINNELWEIPYQARHYAINSAFAIVLALHLKISRQEIREALAKPVELDMRMQIEQHSGNTIIVDCYNANPVSMQSAIEFWHTQLPENPHVAFLGEMLELGESAELYHRMIGAILAERGEHNVFSVGTHARWYQSEVSRHFDSADQLLQKFPALPANAVILVKASHGIHLEKILPILRGEI
jgi:UDP-N-acetylmuramyl-tripeptide synthetase/UDP-N-acetylmuramoyl-tripeptide--D-alanyl-D-alanine ligase